MVRKDMKRPNPRCKNCRERFTPKFNTLEKYCYKDQCKKVEYQEKIEKKQSTKPKAKKRIDRPLSTLIKECEEVFNEYIRKRDIGKSCISCDTILKPPFDAGHFWSVGKYPSVRFWETNVFGQCIECNQLKNGNTEKAKPEVIDRIGKFQFKILDKAKDNSRHYMRHEIIHLINKYKKKVNELDSRRN